MEVEVSHSSIFGFWLWEERNLMRGVFLICVCCREVEVMSTEDKNVYGNGV